jgi:hypothetical protein
MTKCGAVLRAIAGKKKLSFFAKNDFNPLEAVFAVPMVSSRI